MALLDPFSAWSRLLAAGASLAETGMRTVETLAAAQQVIAARSGIIGQAMRSPLTGDHGELGRMAPEKIEAFTRSASASAAALAQARSAWIEHMQHLGMMAARGRPPTAGEIADLGARVATLALGSIEASARLGSVALAPVHGKATANARRLQRRGSAVR